MDKCWDYKPNSEISQASLRRKAEENACKHESENIESLSPEKVRQLVHELQVHQIELEMQNEALQTTQTALEIQRVRYCDLYDLAPVGYCTVNEKGFIIQANLTAATLLEMARNEIVKHSFNEFIFNEDHDIYYLFQKRVIKNSKDEGCVLRMIKKDGTLFWAHLAAMEIVEDNRTELRIVFYNITKRKEAEKAAHESDAKFKNMFDHSPIGKSITMPSGEMEMNNAFCQMVGYSKEELLHRKWQDITYPDDIELTQKILKPLLSGEQEMVRFSKRYLHKNGNVVWADVSTFLYKDDVGKPLYFLTNIIDITERKKSEEKLHKSLLGTISAMSLMVEARDPYTAGHQKRVAALCIAIAKKMGMATDQIEGLQLAAKIHDIGKIKIPAEILSKPSNLSELEFMLIKIHPETGYEMLKDIEFPWKIAAIIRQHHEKLDGSGYPHGLKGNEILLEARILTVADIVEAISNHRPYRAALGVDVAMEIITQERGSKLDADVVDACVSLFKNDEFYFL